MKESIDNLKEAFAGESQANQRLVPDFAKVTHEECPACAHKQAHFELQAENW